jgi:hypothetical protein
MISGVHFHIDVDKPDDCSFLDGRVVLGQLHPHDGSLVSDDGQEVALLRRWSCRLELVDLRERRITSATIVSSSSPG